MDSFFERHELLAASAALAAHASSARDGFRQRDLKFLMELFGNWVFSSEEEQGFQIKNTQVSRFLESLALESYARRVKRAKPPRYTLSRAGLLELIRRLVDSGNKVSERQFYFLHYFISSYKQLLKELIERQGEQFPLALKLEIDSILDTKLLLERRIALTEREIVKIQARHRDSIESSKIARTEFRTNKKLTEVAKTIELEHPYELNSQKPLSELMKSLPPELARWELENGAILRAELIWHPSLSHLQTHLKELRSFLA